MVGSAYAAEGTPSKKLVKPDIIIKNIQIDHVSSTSEGHNVRISVTVFNTFPGTSTGPFKIKVEWTENPTMDRLTPLGTAGITNLYNDPSVAAVHGETRTFEHFVPMGKAYKYIATADYMSQVDEADESNNVNAGGYVAR
jgi:hypothetical protein